MIVVEKNGERFILANYKLVDSIKNGYKLIKFVEIQSIRPHHIAKGIRVEDYIKAQEDLKDKFIDKALKCGRVIKELKKLKK